MNQGILVQEGNGGVPQDRLNFLHAGIDFIAIRQQRMACRDLGCFRRSGNEQVMRLCVLHLHVPFHCSELSAQRMSSDCDADDAARGLEQGRAARHASASSRITSVRGQLHST